MFCFGVIGHMGAGSNAAIAAAATQAIVATQQVVRPQPRVNTLFYGCFISQILRFILLIYVEPVSYAVDFK